MTVRDYQKLKEQADAAKVTAERAAGAREQIMKRLKKEHGCETLKEARSQLEDMTAHIGTLQDKFDAEVTKLQKKWKHLND